MDFPTFHRYRRLVRRGLAEPLRCGTCETEYVLMVGEEDEPLLKCFTCNSLTQPGLALYDRVKEAVESNGRN